MKNVITFVGALVLVAGCGWADVQYTPNPVASKLEAVQTLERALWEQSPDYAPTAVEVEPKYFRVGKGEVETSHKGFVTTAATTVDRVSTVYYDNISEARLYKKGDMYQVVLMSSADEELYRYYQANETKARQFLDALEALRH